MYEYAWKCAQTVNGELQRQPPPPFPYTHTTKYVGDQAGEWAVEKRGPSGENISRKCEEPVRAPERQAPSQGVQEPSIRPCAGCVCVCVYM